MRPLFVLAMMIMPGLAFAAGGDDFNPPKPTDTVKKCWGKRVYDPETKRCVKPKQSSLNDDQLFDDARALAYAGRNADAQAVLSAMQDQNEGRVLTYWGFTHRKLGNDALAHSYYEKALKLDPNNLLARSYYGQALIKQGRLGEAFAEWKEIRARGGAETWAETSLRQALETGQSFTY